MDMGKKGLYMIQSLVFAYIATGILSVSYTHLDVYKRQGLSDRCA